MDLQNICIQVTEHQLRLGKTPPQQCVYFKISALRFGMLSLTRLCAVLKYSTDHAQSSEITSDLCVLYKYCVDIKVEALYKGMNIVSRQKVLLY